MNNKIAFEAQLVPAGEGGGVYAEIPFSVEEVFGTKGRVPVNATIDGEPYKGSLANMGGGCHVIGVLKAIREKIGKQVGDTVHIELVRDTAERTVDVHPALQQALDGHPQAKAIFEALAYSHRKEYNNWVAEAKRSETQEKRVKSTIEMLLNGRKNPNDK